MSICERVSVPQGTSISDDLHAAVICRKYDGYSGIDPETIQLDSLIRNHLCKGIYSDCVRKRECECLDKCRFGQRYMQLTENVTDLQKILKKTSIKQ